MMNIYAIGTSHKFSNVEIRERVAFCDEEIVRALADLRSSIAAEAAIISTCNRTEIYVVPYGDGFDPSTLKSWLRTWKGFDIPDEHLFSLHGADVAEHLFEVASGVDSQIIGDVQIIGQVKAAYLLAQEESTLGKLLSRLFHTALRTGKRVKSGTDLFSGAASVSYAAVELARKIFHPISEQRALVVGAGDTGKLTVQSLCGAGVRQVTVANRSEERARELVGTLGHGDVMRFEQLAERLHEFDIIIVSTGAPHYIIDRDDVARSSDRRRERMQLLVDISVPRNVDPDAASVPGVFAKDLNDLTSVIESNLERRRADLPRARAIIDDELEKFAAWCELLPVTPVVASLKQRSEGIIRAELQKYRHRFSESDFSNIEKLVAGVVKKVIADPMGHLLDEGADREHRLEKAEFVRLLFNLDEHDVAGRSPAAESDTNGSSAPARSPGGLARPTTPKKTVDRSNG